MAIRPSPELMLFFSERFFLAAATAAALLFARPLAVTCAADFAGEADLTSALGPDAVSCTGEANDWTFFFGLEGVKRGDVG